MSEPRPVALSDDMTMLLNLAAPLHPDDRGKFLAGVAAQLQGRDAGDGRVFRIAAEVQRLYLQPERIDHPGKFASARKVRGRLDLIPLCDRMLLGLLHRRQPGKRPEAEEGQQRYTSRRTPHVACVTRHA